MENIEHKQTPIEAVGHIAGLGVSAFRASCRGKHISAAIIVLAGAVLLLGGSFIRHGDTQLFVQVVGCVIGSFGLVGWILSSTKIGGVTRMKIRSHNSRQTGFATIELPFVILAFVALVGVAVGGCLWYKNGQLTTGAWIGFALAIPFIMLAAALLLSWWFDERRRKRDQDAT